jgi:hypothetical protein
MEEVVIADQGHTMACLLRSVMVPDDVLSPRACIVTDPMLEGDEKVRVTHATKTDVLAALDTLDKRLDAMRQSLSMSRS